MREIKGEDIASIWPVEHAVKHTNLHPHPPCIKHVHTHTPSVSRQRQASEQDAAVLCIASCS